MSWILIKLPLNILFHDISKDFLDYRHRVSLITPDDPMVNAWLEVIGKIIYSQQDEFAFLLNSFASLKIFGVLFKLPQVVSFPCCVNLYLFFFNYTTFYVEYGLLRVFAKTQNFILYELWKGCVFCLHLGLP